MGVGDWLDDLSAKEAEILAVEDKNSRYGNMQRKDLQEEPRANACWVASSSNLKVLSFPMVETITYTNSKTLSEGMERKTTRTFLHFHSLRLCTVLQPAPLA